MIFQFFPKVLAKWIFGCFFSGKKVNKILLKNYFSEKWQAWDERTPDLDRTSIIW